MAAKLKIEKRGDEIIPLEMQFFVDSLSQNLAFPTSHFVIELLPFDYLSNQKQRVNKKLHLKRNNFIPPFFYF
jgi:hypothetical protein